MVDGNPYTIRVWGNLYDNLGALAKRWFWQARYTLTSPIVNSCWVGSGANVRPTLLQEEVWWESTATQWLMGNGVNLGEMGSPTNGPYAPAGNSPDPTKLEPTGNALVMNRSQYMGLDAGWLWYGSNPTGLYCLRSTQ